MTTVFGDITPPTVTVNLPRADLDFDETLELATAQTYAITYLLEQALTTVWVNSGAQFVEVTLDGDCEAARAALETTSCFYERSDGTNTLRVAAEMGLDSKAVRLNAALDRMIRDAAYEPLGGDHGIGNATNTIDDGSGNVSLTLWDAADYGELDVYDTHESTRGEDGRADVMVGTAPDLLGTAILYCNGLTLDINTRDVSEQGRQRAEQVAQQIAGVMDCGPSR